MAVSLREYRARIKSTESMKKITRAMELIAASRIVKAQARVAAAVAPLLAWPTCAAPASWRPLRRNGHRPSCRSGPALRNPSNAKSRRVR